MDGAKCAKCWTLTPESVRKSTLVTVVGKFHNRNKLL